MSSSSAKILLCIRWLCLLVIFCINSPSCEGSQKWCGKALPDALDMICKNGFVGKKVKKSIDPLDYYVNIEDEIPSPFEEWPFLTKIANNVLAKTRRRRHLGVSDECCRKPCSIPELRTYCV